MSEPDLPRPDKWGTVELGFGNLFPFPLPQDVCPDCISAILHLWIAPIPPGYTPDGLPGYLGS
jgi:hypothetical protein